MLSRPRCVQSRARWRSGRDASDDRCRHCWQHVEISAEVGEPPAECWQTNAGGACCQEARCEVIATLALYLTDRDVGFGLVGLAVGLLLGFVGWRVAEFVQLTGDRLRLKRTRAELAEATNTRDASRRLRIFWRTVGKNGDRDHVIYTCELRDLLDVIVGSGEPFCAVPGVALPGEFRLAPGESVWVELSSERDLAPACVVTRVSALERPA